MPPEIPPRWKERVRQHILKSRDVHYETLSVYDFPHGQSVRVTFPDGSYAWFQYAFFLHDPELREVAVFTEHCGYYFFPEHELKVEVLKSVGGVSFPEPE